ncbi:hypothetical protein CFC21_096533 [Triticum aestivum]|uniref:Ubiquitin-like protease family profile domain-containing protein n=2 Tax=Triticum aestivum TaxID=4565 RepID=A0A9R1LSE6_WHEAT|nr:hypothetical protein CFC21_096533 [Triticum aestivum]
MPHERKMYENITFLANVEGSKPTVLIGKTIATFGQLGNSMKIGGRVQAYVINVYCRHLFNENHPRNSLKHYFFHTASEYFLGKWKNDEARIWWRKKLIRVSLELEKHIIFRCQTRQISSFICTWYEARLQPMDFNAFPAVYPKVPQQDNNIDCGIFTMKLMGWCPRNPTPIVFSPKDVPDARIRYAVDLMFSHYNTLDDEKKRVKEFRL